MVLLFLMTIPFFSISCMMRILIEQRSCIVGYRLLVERCTTPTATTITGTTERVLIIVLVVVVLLLLQLEDITQILHTSDVDVCFGFDSIQQILLFGIFRRCFEQLIQNHSDVRF